MFERFTDRARRVVVLAQEEARMLNHSYIGTEHILLGLIHEGEGVAAKALESMDISLGAVREKVQEDIGQGQQNPPGHIPFTPRAKKVLELSLREALQLGHNYIGTEHILLGLIREGEGVAAQVLVKLGADLNRVDLRNVNLSGATLRGASLVKALLAGARMIMADLSGADLSGANLSGADLSGANLSYARLNGADLHDALLCPAQILDGNGKPSGRIWATSLLGADLRRAHLVGTQLASANLSEANLDLADLAGADLTGAKLPGAPYFR